MALPREFWVLLNQLPQRFRNWFVRPAAGLATETLPDASAADSSDLLRRRMKALNLDPDDVDRPAAKFLGIETGLCAHCASRGQCMKDLDDEFADPGWGDWRNYCPNATTLTILSTLGSCAEDRQDEAKPDEAGATI